MYNVSFDFPYFSWRERKRMRERGRRERREEENSVASKATFCILA